MKPTKPNPAPDVYVDLLLWTIKWYHDCVERVQKDTANADARRTWTDGADKALSALHEHYGLRR